MEFLLGCNYWSSNAGADMWANFDIEIVKKDLHLLSSHGVKIIRVFPNWRDFQPIMPVYRGKNNFIKYIWEGDRIPDNPYYLDGTAMDNFSAFLDECENKCNRDNNVSNDKCCNRDQQNQGNVSENISLCFGTVGLEIPHELPDQKSCYGSRNRYRNIEQSIP